MKRAFFILIILLLLMNFCLGEVFDYNIATQYGIATKGPLELSGNILVDGVINSIESNVYIESINYDNALTIINCQIGGDVTIVNPDAYVTLLGGNAGIGGEIGMEASMEHVEIGAPQTVFPIPNTDYFERYATGITIDSSTDLSTLTTLNNVRIAAGTNPTFHSNVQINGVLYIEQPNVVTFNGNVDITGIIVGAGDYKDDSGANQINFYNISSDSVSNLPESFGSLRNETGVFIVAPGFAVSIGGPFGTLNGCIAVNGVEFFGDAGGTIGGSILNYSREPMVLSSNYDLFFNRSGQILIPAGFVYPECINPPSMDINNDCKVDLIDFSVFASEWMSCGYNIQSECW